VEAADDEITRQAYELLREAQVAAPEAVNRVLDHPYVGAWATRTALRSRRGHSSAPADLARVAAAAAIRVRVSTTVWLPPGEVLALPSLRRTSAPSVRTCSESSSSRSAGPDQGVRPAGFARGSATRRRIQAS
jgi:HEXXH motif-containing protein